MNVTLLYHTPQTVAETAATMCYRAKDGHKALMNALKSGHESLIEHLNFTFLIEDVSRVTLAQLTRHRLASYSVESQRYCGANMQCVIPDTINCDDELLMDVHKLCDQVEAFYQKALQKGVPAEDARYLTFQGGVTNLVMTMNARELRHFFSLRCCNRAQWEIRELADEMLRLCKQAMPDVFASAGAPCRRGKCPEGERSCGRVKNENQS